MRFRYGLDETPKRVATVEGFAFFLKGAAVGFAIAAPVGPVGVLCVRRTLLFGRLIGLISGLGAATADAAYGAVAAFGVTLVSTWLLDHEQAFRFAGGMFLLALGGRMLLAKPHRPVAPEEQAPLHHRFLHAFGTTFVLTITNPVTIIAFLGIFASVGITSLAEQRELAVSMVAGVFAGSALWWLILAGGAGMLRDWLNNSGLRWVNRLSGITILGFGVYALTGLIAGFGAPIP